MSHDALHERGQALENRFFQERDRQLLKKMRAEAQAKGARESLSQVSGVTDEAVLNELLKNNITAESLAAISLVPLIMVAWADDKMEEAEKEAVLKAAAESGIKSDQPAFQIIQSWLENRPDDDLMSAWRDYVNALASTMEAAAFDQLRETVVQRAENVAAAAGGFLGLGPKISAVERKVLNHVDNVFAGKSQSSQST